MYGYAPYLQNYQQNYQPTQQNTSQDERIWVSNQQAAESYLISPNGFARLWDSSQSRFYEKRADATGRPLPMEIYEYKRVLPQIDVLTDNTNKISFDEINGKIEEITQRIEALEKAKKVTRNAKQPDADDTSV